jgi:hypothetical protein
MACSPADTERTRDTAHGAARERSLCYPPLTTSTLVAD